MIEKIKELRVQIDGLSQLVKNLKSFEFITKELSKEATDVALGNIESTPDNFSISTQPNRFHHLIRTDRGTFRFSTAAGDTSQYLIDQKSKEINKCYESLILAKAWLGKVLGELGNPTPYQNDGKRIDVSSIEKTADTNFIKQDELFYKINSEGFNHIQKVDWIRQEIEKVSSNFHPIKRDVNFEVYMVYEEYTLKYLCEARFWLGFELQRIKETSTNA